MGEKIDISHQFLNGDGTPVALDGDKTYIITMSTVRLYDHDKVKGIQYWIVTHFVA